jgi:natural product biosynthesis luciferase-like monooxygenase protein
MGMSLAAGWHADDFVLAPDVYEQRKAVLLERLATVRALWRGESVRRAGPGGREVEIRAYPRPERLPDVWLTSSGNVATWETAGQHGLHVLTALLEQTVDDLAGKADRYRAALADAGHSAAGKQITCMLHTHLARNPDVVADRVRRPLTQYLSAHMRLFEKFATHQDIGIRPEAVSDADRAVLLEHGVRRYTMSAGLFGSGETCRPMIDRLLAAGVTELGCLVDFGLSSEQVLECVDELGRLQAAIAR